MSRRVPRLPADSSSSDVERPRPTETPSGVCASEGARTRLISDICSLLHEPAIPDSARSAGLELIGWLARRMPGEAPHALGVAEATQAKRASRRKLR
jgi:hypothetical protein